MSSRGIFRISGGFTVNPEVEAELGVEDELELYKPRVLYVFAGETINFNGGGDCAEAAIQDAPMLVEGMLLEGDEYGFIAGMKEPDESSTTFTIGMRDEVDFIIESKE
jgi:hypothetical protein